MERATDNEANAHYNDEITFLDGLVELHPEIFAAMSAEDREVLRTYYLVGQPVPENVFEYRKDLIHQLPDIQTEASAAFNRLLAALDIDEFKYTTKLSGLKQE
jgi:hypothetical protein